MKELIFSIVLLGNLQLTSYRSLVSQTDTTPFITATGERVHHKGVALSRDLLKRWGGPVDYGDVVYIRHFGFKIVNDAMNKRHTKAIDLWVETYEEEKAIGVKKAEVWLIKIGKLQRE